MELSMQHDLELCILSCMLMDAEALHKATETLSPEDFTREDLRLVYGALVLCPDIPPLDLLVLADTLKKQGLKDPAGLLRAISSTTSTSAEIDRFIAMLKDASKRRRLAMMGMQITSESQNPQAPVVDIVTEIEGQLAHLQELDEPEPNASIDDLLPEAVEEIERIYKNGGALPGISTGFAELDNITAGLHKGDLILIAARPSMGKTAIALNIAANAAINHSIPTAIFSLEMSRRQMVNRLIASIGGVEASRLRTGKLASADWDAIAYACGRISGAPLSIYDSGIQTVAQIRARARARARARCRKTSPAPALIVIDYMQLMDTTTKTSNRQESISDISRGLKALARELDCPIIALSQLNRAPESRSCRRPLLSDLRESGAIEQDADLVCFVYRDEYYNPETEKRGIAEIIISKQRNGATGKIELGFQGEFVRFVDPLAFVQRRP